VAAERWPRRLHLRERGLSRLPDQVIFALAIEEQRVIVTADLDFSRIVALSGRREPGLILFRAGNISDQDMLRLLKEVLSHLAAGVVEHAVVVVDRHGFRTAPLPLRPDLMPDNAD
jgi:predicted nuclease of predicted toxin-antitoxin system